jgi:hypothetical protein
MMSVFISQLQDWVGEMTCVINNMLSDLACYECLTPGMLRYQFLMNNIEQQPARLMRERMEVLKPKFILCNQRAGVSCDDGGIRF